MDTSATTQSSAPADIDNRALRKVIVAGAIGTTIEFFDYGVYGVYATIIAKQLFSSRNPTSALLSAFAAFAASFVVRPLGGLVFGHFSDRVGRKNMLALMILLMGASTVGIGLLPTYRSVGVAATILLVILRLLQGVSAGGEVSGGNSYIAECARDGSRAFAVCWTQVGTLLALLLGSGLGLVLISALGDQRVSAWGWRIPFLAAAPLAAVGFYIRTRLDESPQFKNLANADATARMPVIEVLADPDVRKRLILALLVTLLNSPGYYVVFAYMPTYLTSEVGISEHSSFLITALSLVAAMTLTPIAARIADRVGRKPVSFYTALATAILAYPCYWGIAHGGFAGAMTGAIALGILYSGQAGIVQIIHAELFPTRIRSTAYGLAYNVRSAIFSGASPLIITWLISRTGDVTTPAYYVIGAAVVSTLATLAMAETAHKPLDATRVSADSAPELERNPGPST